MASCLAVAADWLWVDFGAALFLVLIFPIAVGERIVGYRGLALFYNCVAGTVGKVVRRPDRCYLPTWPNALCTVPLHWMIANGATRRAAETTTCGCGTYGVAAEHTLGPLAPAPLGISTDRPDYLSINWQAVRALLQYCLGHSVRGEVAWNDREFIVTADVILNANLVLLHGCA